MAQPSDRAGSSPERPSAWRRFRAETHRAFPKRFADGHLEARFIETSDASAIARFRLVFLAATALGVLDLALAPPPGIAQPDAVSRLVLLTLAGIGVLMSFSALAHPAIPKLAVMWSLGAVVTLALEPNWFVTLGFDGLTAKASPFLGALVALLIVGATGFRVRTLAVIAVSMVVAGLAAGRQELAGLAALATLAGLWHEVAARRRFALRYALERQTELSDQVLFNVLPERIVHRIRSGEFPLVDTLQEATVVFADLTGFTAFAASVTPDRLVRLLDELWSRFDDTVADHGLEKLKTVGDAYMAVSGGSRNPRLDAAMTCGAIHAAQRMIAIVQEIATREEYALDMRVGVHTGPVVAGVIGRYRYQFDVWGDTVNVASRLEENGIPGRIHVSAATAARIRDRFETEPRGEVDVRGRGIIETFLVVREREPTLPLHASIRRYGADRAGAGQSMQENSSPDPDDTWNASR